MDTILKVLLEFNLEQHGLRNLKILYNREYQSYIIEVAIHNIFFGVSIVESITKDYDKTKLVITSYFNKRINEIG